MPLPVKPPRGMDHADCVYLSSTLFAHFREVFKTQADIDRLRASSSLWSPATPHWATVEHFRRGVYANWGIAAEALALLLYHFAFDKHMSGKEVEKYRDAVKYTHSWLNDDNFQDSNEIWHQSADDDWEGNPATAIVVTRAVQLAYDLEKSRHDSKPAPAAT
ncbi:unnamed protein product [Peniophora sp. CBMAI 1063]|nr:unnamed protein product [Peniophora sp. CBMAI 1063]